MKPASNHFNALHGLRGVAALAIVFRHMRGVTGVDLTPSSHLAVDLFFILSGFVIAHAYENRLKGDMSFRRFCVVRLIRLYPLYVLGLAIGVALILAKMYLGSDDALSPTLTALVIATGLFFLPTPPMAPPNFLFPSNVPAWSLFFELGVNFFYAAVARVLSRGMLVGLIGLTAVALAAGTWTLHTIDGGAEWRNAWMGVPRVAFGFFLGVYLRRYHLGRPVGGKLFGAMTFLVLCGVLLAIFMYRPTTPNRAFVFELGAVMVAFPAVILAAARVQLGGVWQQVAHEMGEISYPVYVLHVPLLFWATAIAERTLGWVHGSFPLIVEPIFVVFIALVALLAARAYDFPLHRFLTSRLHARPARERVTQF